MDWVYNVPIKFFEYDLEEFKNRLSEVTNQNTLFIGSKRLISSFDLDVSSFQVLDESLANPNIHLVEYVLEKIEKPDLIIAVGGGSSIDLAKAVSALYEYKNEDVLDLLKSKEYLENSIEAREKRETFMTIIKTALPIAGGALVMSLGSWIDSIIIMESYWSRPSNSYTRVLARNSINIIQKYLPLVLKDLDNLEYRKQMLMGSFFAGLAFSNTRTTACHSISYPLTMLFNINHGFAAAVTLYEVLYRNWDYLKEKDLFLKAFEANDLDEIKDWFDNVTNDVQDLKLSSFNIKKEDIPRIVELATTGGRMDNNPINFNEEEIEDILNSVF